jgi:hypothetical protein
MVSWAIPGNYHVIYSDDRVPLCCILKKLPLKLQKDWGSMKCNIVWGKVKHLCYFSEKTSLKFVLSKYKIRVLFRPVFYIAPFSLRLVKLLRLVSFLIKKKHICLKLFPSFALLHRNLGSLKGSGTANTDMEPSHAKIIFNCQIWNMREVLV